MYSFYVSTTSNFQTLHKYFYYLQINTGDIKLSELNLNQAQYVSSELVVLMKQLTKTKYNLLWHKH
jgi:hypothetical protein